MATTPSLVPESITTWVAARTDESRAHLLRRTLAANVHFSFAGRERFGVDDVVAYLEQTPTRGLASAEHRVIDRGEGHFTVRFTGPAGSPLPSPGGPLSAMDFELTLDGDGMIAALSPNPQHTEPNDLAAPLRPGDQMPLFSLPDVHGRPTSWKTADHRVHVVMFTCNGCPWARGWHDRIQDVVREYEPRGVGVVQINANDPSASPADSVDRSRARFDNGEFAGPYLVDEHQSIAKRLGGRHTPDIFVVDEQDVIAYHGAPDADSERPVLRAEWLRAALDAVLEERDVALAETEPIGCTIKWRF